MVCRRRHLQGDLHQVRLRHPYCQTLWRKYPLRQVAVLQGFFKRKICYVKYIGKSKSEIKNGGHGPEKGVISSDLKVSSVFFTTNHMVTFNDVISRTRILPIDIMQYALPIAVIIIVHRKYKKQWNSIINVIKC